MKKIRADKTAVIVISAFILVIGILSNSLFKTAEVIRSSTDHIGCAAADLFKGDGSHAPKYEKASKLIRDYTEDVVLMDCWVNISGAVIKALGIDDYYKDRNVYLTEGDYIISRYPKNNCDYEIAELKEFKDYLDNKGIDFLYVNIPAKYEDDDAITDNFGLDNHSNENTDLFIQRLRDETDIKYIDLRENVKGQGIDLKEMFYATDHHWKTPYGLWASRTIAEEMNDVFGYDIPLDKLADENYIFRTEEKSWLGEEGKLYGTLNMKAEDYIDVVPAFQTDYYAAKGSESAEGSFEEVFIYNEPGYYHYKGYSHYENRDLDRVKVLYISDSFAATVTRFLINGVATIDTIQLRYSDNLIDMLEENDYDIVLMAYSQSMIGAHEDASSANYNMFNLGDR